jgi:pSer/pThr/pTyr-binding forkhead associated (FHA) protein
VAGNIRPTGYALRFISGKYLGAEYPLRWGREIIAGRSGEIDMILAEDMVSRRHARIFPEQNRLLIQDLGSTNGTFVNGQKVSEAYLREGDTVLIGTSILKVVPHQDRGQSDAEIRRSLYDIAARRPNQTTSALQGNIEEIPLVDLLQMFSTSKKSGVLAIRGPGVGKIYLRDGQIYFASIDDNLEAGPLKSMYRLLTWKRGSFELGPASRQEFPEEIEGSTEGILMEGLRQMDELRRIEKDVPPIIATLRLATPLNPPLSALSPEYLDLVQTVINEGQVISILNKSRLTDLETFQALIYLIQNRYLQVEL